MTLDDILDEMGESYYPYHEYGDNEVYVISNKEQKTAAKQAILSDLLEIIGEDETTVRNGLVGLTHKDETRNQLRQELRTKLKEYCGIA